MLDIGHPVRYLIRLSLWIGRKGMENLPQKHAGVSAPKLLVGQWNLCQRLGRRPKAQPFLLPWWVAVPSMGTSGCGAKEAHRTSGCLAGKPDPRENQGWITMKTNCKSGENPCSSHGMGWACLESLQMWKGPRSLCREGGIWWLHSFRRKHLEWHGHIPPFCGAVVLGDCQSGLVLET